MDRRPTHPLPPPRSTVDTMPGQPTARPNPQPPPARRWSWSLEPDAPVWAATGDAGGDEWWASLRPLPLDRQAKTPTRTAGEPPPAPAATPAPERAEPQPESPAAFAAASDEAPISSAPPPPMVTDLVDPPPPSRRWLMPALVAAAALTVVLGTQIDGDTAAVLGRAAALQPSGAPALAGLPGVDARADMARLAAIARLGIERASRELAPAPSRLVVSSARPCEQIWLDARQRGSGQGRAFVVSPGAHAVGCRLPSGRMSVRQAVVAEGGTTRVFFAP